MISKLRNRERELLEQLSQIGDDPIVSTVITHKLEELREVLKIATTQEGTIELEGQTHSVTFKPSALRWSVCAGVALLIFSVGYLLGNQTPKVVEVNQGLSRDMEYELGIMVKKIRRATEFEFANDDVDTFSRFKLLEWKLINSEKPFPTQYDFELKRLGESTLLFLDDRDY